MIPYTTILADVPWAYDQKLKMSDGVHRSSESQYSTMSLEEIAGLYTLSRVLGDGQRIPGMLAGHAIADVAFLWFWVTNPFLLDGTGAMICRAWGFEPKQIVPWIKGRIQLIPPRDGCHDLPNPQLVLNTGMGHITRGVTEHLIIATRGKYTSLVKVRNEHGLIVAPEESVILSPRGAHSRKPKQQYAMIERVCPGPYLELFATERREGWTSWGKSLESSPPTSNQLYPPRYMEVTVQGPADPRLAQEPGVRVIKDEELIEWPTYQPRVR